jgi:Tfp pilus assembly protein PilF
MLLMFRSSTTGRPALVLLAAALVIASACSQKSDGERSVELVNRGLEKQANQQIAEAARSYREALVYDANNKFAYYNLGLIEQQAGRMGSAEGFYRITLSLDPKFGPALFNLAIVITPTSPRNAAALYRSLLEADPNNAAAHLNLGFVLKTLGEEQAGERELQRAIDIDPSLESRVNAAQSTDAESLAQR